VFAALLAFRDETVLAVFNVLALLGLVGLSVALLPGSGLNLFALRMRDVVFAAIENGIQAALGALLFVFRDGMKLFRRNGASSVDTMLAGAIGRSVLLGVVLTLFFGMLLAVGDPVFRHVVTPLVDWNVPQLGAHVFTVGFFTWPVLGLLSAIRNRAPAERTASVGNRIARFVAPEGTPASPALSLNRLDTLVALGAMNGLFALFVLLQFRVLFGGQAYVTATTGLTLAEYARGGFFALTFTAALVIGVLLAIDALLRGGNLAGWRVSRGLSLSLLGLVGVMLGSAAGRMMMYVGSFGISVDRIVALAIMAWLTAVGAWFAATVLRGRPARFVVGSLAFGAVTLLSLNAINVEAIVVNSATTRVANTQAANARPFDVIYMTRELSGDGVPALTRAVVSGRLRGAGAAVGIGTLRADTGTPVDAECMTAMELLNRWGPDTKTRATAWTFGAWRARRAVASNAAALRARACPVVEVAPAARATRTTDTVPIAPPAATAPVTRPTTPSTTSQPSR
jgi:hypothetical protein